MKAPHKWAFAKFGGWLDKRVYTTLQKYREVPISSGNYGFRGTDAVPVFERKLSPQVIYEIRRNSALINNSIEEKVNQTFRRGWDEWEKRYEAKCPECEEEFGSETPFREQYDGIPEDSDIDFDHERRCPECEEMVTMETPDPKEKQRAKSFFEKVNERNRYESDLEPRGTNSVSQSMLEVLREATLDLESFDNEWLIFNREYKLSDDGHIEDYKLYEVYRAPPEKMRYVVDEDTGKFGGRWWVCLTCRESNANYVPEEEPQPCSHCGNKTYEVYAYGADGQKGEEPSSWYIKGEFIHRTMYETTRFYGYSPIVSLYDESMALEYMDRWYRSAYEKRRAPRGALAIKSSNAQATHEWNKEQFEKLKNDPNHIPTLMDDGETDGDPISFINLLENPAEMQHMEMRKWFMERISAKWGVMPIFQGAPAESGLSQSMEVMVSNRAADRTRKIQNEIVDVILRQLGIEGWTIEVAPVEEEDEQQQAELRLKHLQMLQQAAQLGLEAEWTEDDTANIKPGAIDPDQGDDGEMPGMGGLDGLGNDMAGGEDTGSVPAEDGPDDGGGSVDLGSAATGGQSPSAPSMPAERDGDKGG